MKREPKRCSEREPADSLRDKFNVIGGWLIAIPELFIEARRARRSCSPQLL
jgi:hypothetical protein